MNALVAACLFVPVLAASAPSPDEILSVVAKNAVARHAAVYSAWRQYSLRNLRFGKSASATVRITSRPSEGKQFTIVSRSGAARMISVIESLLSSEADSSKPGKARDHEIGPSNYRASLQGSQILAGRDCWVLTLIPKSKSKYLVKGTAWVDKINNSIVRLDGTTAATVSIWIGTPQIIEDFAPICGIWLPVHTVSKSTSLLLGESDLDIRYMDYKVESVGGER